MVRPCRTLRHRIRYLPTTDKSPPCLGEERRTARRLRDEDTLRLENERWFTPHALQDGMLAYRLIERADLEDGATVRIGGERVADLDRAAGVEPLGNLAGKSVV